MINQSVQPTLVDPIHFTDYNRNKIQLEAAILFCILAAGKAALPAARALDRLLANARLHLFSNEESPFSLLYLVGYSQLALLMQHSGIGCYNRKSQTIFKLIDSDLDIKTCTTTELERIYGIGPKTSRFFIVHTRPNQRLAVLDRHILNFLREHGHTVPNSTPTNAKKYRKLEDLALWYADKAKMSPADWDLYIWNQYRRKETRELQGV